MGAGFTRRYNFVPGTQVITLIEGIIILDLPPPGNIAGIQTGVVCLVGEFQDSTYGVAVDANGNVTQSPNPVQVFSGADLIAKTGGFDATIGDFGGTMGNGFVELRNKKFSQLVVLPVPLSSARATRQFRKLPFNLSATSPTPVVPMQAAAVPAGSPFLNGTQQVNSAGPVAFTGLLPYLSGVDGGIVASVGATETLTSASSNFISSNVAVGDVVVTGAPLSSAVVGSWTGAAAILPTDAVITLQGGAQGFTGYPATGLLQIDSEFATYTGVTSSASGSAFTGVSRGVNGTVGATHAVGAIAVGMNNVDTYRVQAVPGTTALTLERQDRTNFSSSNSFGASGVPWRIHKFSDAESAAGIGANAGAYTVPARPLAGAVPAATVLPPQSPAPAPAYNSWNPLSGLQMLTDPTTGLAFTSAVQAPNPGQSATLDALYATALAATLSQNMPMAAVNLLWAARKSANIRSQLRQAVDNESAIGVGRMAVLAPDLQGVTSTNQAIASADPGVGGQRDERVLYTWPAVQSFIPEAVNQNIKGSDQQYHQDGVIDMPADGWLVAVLSNINPEWNPGQAAEPVPTILSPIVNFARNQQRLSLQINDYIALKQAGVCALRNDRKVGFVFQSGVTTSLVSGQTEIARRRLADFIEDSIADATAEKAKLPISEQWKDDVTTEIDTFLDGLLSPDNPKQQRISNYSVDDETGNTQALEAQGVFVVIVRVQKTPTADFIVYQFEIGNGVVISSALAA